MLMLGVPGTKAFPSVSLITRPDWMQNAALPFTVNLVRVESGRIPQLRML